MEKLQGSQRTGHLVPIDWGTVGKLGYVKTPQRTLLSISSRFENHLPALLQPPSLSSTATTSLTTAIITVATTAVATGDDRLPPLHLQQHRCGSMPCPQCWPSTQLLPLSFLPHPPLQLLLSYLHLQECSCLLSSIFDPFLLLASIFAANSSI